MLSLAQRLDRLEPLASAKSGEVKESVYGVVDRVDLIGGVKVPHFCRKWKGSIGNMRPTDEEPTIYCIEKLEPALLKHKKYKCFFGGRAGTKSIFAMDSMIGDVNAHGSKVYVLREHLKQLKDSIYSGIADRVGDLKIGGFTPVPTQWEIRHNSGGKFTFGGMQNIAGMKGSFRYKYFLMEEAAKTKQQTIDVLGPTLRDVEGAELWYVWNPESISDPMSKEYIVPYQADLDRQGFYEDDYHMIFKVGYEDNPWFEHDESLRTELEKDKSKVARGLMSEGRYKHIWHGGFMDDIENSLIKEEWFDACVNAHKILGFEPAGGTAFGFDPADTGGDAHGYSVRHGRVVTQCGEIDAENGNRATDEACGMARKSLADYFIWDCDGLGATLRDNVSNGIGQSKIEPVMFKGSETPEEPDAPFNDGDAYQFKNQPTNKEAIRNKRAQGYVKLARAMRKTFEAVTKAKSGICPVIDIDEIISFDSEGIENMAKLKSELCRLPVKPASGQILLYSKDEMRRGIRMPDGSTIVIPSPNMGDSVMMCMFEMPAATTDWGELDYQDEYIA